MLPLLFMIACSGDPATGEGSQSDPVITPILPVLQAEEPARGAFTGTDQVVLSGKVDVGSAPLDSITLNGEPVSFSGGSAQASSTFQANIDWQPGINIIGLRATDTDGERAVDGRAFLAGPVHEPGEALQDALRLQLGPELLDDDDPDVDDLARIAELVLADDTLSDSLVGLDMESDYFVLTPTSLSFSRADVDIVPDDGQLEAAITLHDVWMDFDVQGTGWYDFVSTNGSAWVDEAVLDLVLAVSSSGGHIDVRPVISTATLDGYGLTVDWFPDSLEGYLADWTQTTLEDQIAATAEEQVGDLVGGYLEAFATDFEFGDGMVLSLSLADLAVGTDGLRLTMDVAVSASPGIDVPPGAGSPSSTGAPPPWPLTTTAPFAVAAADDLVNQILFAFWYSGSLSGFSFGGVELGGLSGAQIPEPLGPVDTVEMSVGLPPVLSEATQDDQQVDISVGEARMAFHREDGVDFDFSVNLRTGMVVGVGDDGAVDFALDGRPAMMTLEIGVLDSPDFLDPGDLAALVRLMVPPLLMNASSFAPTFQLPGIPLDGLSDLPSLQGLELFARDPELSVEDGGWVLATARLTAE